MKTCFAAILPIGIALASTPVHAVDDELMGACMQSGAGNQEECICFAGKIGTEINDDERTFALAILTEDESKLDPIRGSFTQADAQAMQGKTTDAMLACMAG
jgi:hypothetical protein